MEGAAANRILRAWKPPIAGVREMLQASFATHTYPAHTHDVWTVFIVDDGAIRYELAGTEHAAGQARVGVLPPHVVHDGRPARSAGYRKRVLYLETSLLGEHLIGPAVDRPVVPDPILRSRVAALYAVLDRGDDLLEAETRLAFVSEAIAQSYGEPSASPPERPASELAEQLRAYLDAAVFEPVTIRAAAAAVGASPTQVTRAFSSVFGIAPHAYVTGRRLEAARDRILRGQALADVAAEVGFVDQAHLSRRFRSFLGTTPGQYRSGALPA